MFRMLGPSMLVPTHRAAVVAALIILGPVLAESAEPSGETVEAARKCPPEMVLVRKFCIDRWEAAMVDKGTGRSLSPYYPPQPRLLKEVFQAWDIDRANFGSDGARAMPIPEVSEWQRTHDFDPKAISRPGAVPQAYLSYPLAKRACENADKRLCTRDEWVAACKGESATKFPYGEGYDRSKCNVWGFVHPGVVLHQSATFGHRDPRLNLVSESGEKPYLRLTGATPTCASRWGKDAAYDMVGNIDEWVEGDRPEFVGGFYARSTSNGCESRVTNHAPSYYDYSIGVRCCRDAAP
jgi:formylglycine-generating enzyme required for sulfatase activity